ncbi:hypothetical protein [Agrococcus sp. KRD186]|jgi:hypothetical protein|uniref:hypothetical protein n=1 Tax=Agrococcus sp. KRD186 TaxID=2729730 RepID=UPI0019D00CDA|nr:hypothetical protein [Agrococcus sp. KRD186]
MLARLTSGIALASIAALVLVGCTPPEPSDDEVLAEARESFDSFYQTVDEQMAAGSASATDFEEYATRELAAQWAQDVQAVIDDGTTSRGVLEVVDLALVDRSDDRISTHLCTDGRNITTTHPDGSMQEPSGLVAWSATFVPRDDSSRLLLASLDPIQDQAICE